MWDNGQTFNKGEWAEIYAILKSLSIGKLKLCDSNINYFNKDLPILEWILDDGNSIKIDLDKSTATMDTKTISLAKFDLLSRQLWMDINKKSGTFSAIYIDEFFSKLGISQLKSGSLSKRDVTFIINDLLSQKSNKLGFSIKSYVKNNPTLLNASSQTNFKFKISKTQNNFNNLKTKKLVKSLMENNASIQYWCMESETFHNNLMQIDTRMPEIVAELLKFYYSGKYTNISDIGNALMKKDPLRLNNVKIYQQKIKELLLAVACGMFPSIHWNKIMDVNGGCIIVKEDSDILTFYIPDKTSICMFQNYLYQSCYFETASTTRHRFGNIYHENGSYFLNLNLQIRMKVIN